VKDKNTTKYLQLTEIRDEAISSGKFERETVLHCRSDIIMLLFESNDPEQVNFVKDAYKRIKQIQDLRFTPILLVQTKMDLT